MRLVTDREREVIAQCAPVLVEGFDELAAEWRAAWSSMTGSEADVDLPAMTRVALTDGLDAGLKAQRDIAVQLVATNVPLDTVVSMVLLWEAIVHRHLARAAIDETFTPATAITRYVHELVLYVAEGYSQALRHQRDDIRQGLEEADRMKSDLISMISHDLKTPLTTIEACAESMLRADDLELTQQVRFLEMILRNAERLSRLITRIVDVSRIEARAMEFNVTALDLRLVVRRVLDSLLPLATVDVNIGEDLPAVLADRDALDRIVVNLIDNAVRFSPRDVPVRLEADADGAYVELRVIDAGPGIPASRAAGLFTKFFQVDSSASAHRSGSGLGLAIVRGLAVAMGGDAGYLPGSPSGSVFWVRFPAQVPIGVQAADDSRSSRPTRLRRCCLSMTRPTSLRYWPSGCAGPGSECS